MRDRFSWRHGWGRDELDRIAGATAAVHIIECGPLRDLLGRPDTVAIERYERPRLHGISFVLRDYFPPSGSANLALDQIGKSLGEFLRARHVDVPTALLTA